MASSGGGVRPFEPPDLRALLGAAEHPPVGGVDVDGGDPVGAGQQRRPPGQPASPPRVRGVTARLPPQLLGRDGLRLHDLAQISDHRTQLGHDRSQVVLGLLHRFGHPPVITARPSKTNSGNEAQPGQTLAQTE